MSKSIFVFTREISDENGPLKQTVTVYSKDAERARATLDSELESLRTTSSGLDPVYAASEDWLVHEVPLSDDIVVTSATTR